jgi:hypothetical protein
MVKCFARRVCIALAALALFGVSAPAQTQQPSAAAIAAAKEILTLKGALVLFSGVVPRVVETAKGALLQSNPMLSKDLNEVAAKLKVDLAGRAKEVEDNAFRVYASHFTDAEMKEVLAFYKTATGQKVIAEEPKILDESVTFADAWARKLSEEVIAKFRAEMKSRGNDL